MTFRIASLTMWTLWAISGLWGNMALQAQQPPASSQPAAQESGRSVLDGVYTEEQAKRGEPLYGQFCASCHGATMEGMDMAPGLAGGAFIANWNGTSVGDLFERIRVTMPQDDPGKLSRAQSADLVAYLLSVNKYPAGKTELPRDTEPLKQIKFEAAK